MIRKNKMAETKKEKAIFSKTKLSVSD